MGELILVRVVELDLVVLEEVLVVVREDRVDAAHLRRGGDSNWV
jgi:hypothetical protein